MNAPFCQSAFVKGISVAAAILIVGCLYPAGASAQSGVLVPLDDELIDYEHAPLSDPVTLLSKRLASGEVKLHHDKQFGYLPTLLRTLEVPVSSQTLVYSKTSFQLRRISPDTPRAIYFNDDVYIGFVHHGDVIEVSSVDPQVGGVFYTLSQKPAPGTTFERNAQCLQCHASMRTDGVPGHLVRSVFSDPQGFPLFAAGTFNTDHTSPLKERWGGWYVTGKRQPAAHMGNLLFESQEEAERADLTAGTRVTDLKDRFDTSNYLSPHSDIVALMVLEHQTRMHNLLTRAHYEARSALQHQAVMNRMLNEPADRLSDSTKRRFKSAADRLLKYLLFIEEAPLDDAIEGSSGFADEFAARGPFDPHRRSLRQFDLTKRMFTYPCSYLIYSKAFDSLPKPMMDYVYRSLWEILTNKDTSETFARLTTADRKAILEILLATKKGLPEYWREAP